MMEATDTPCMLLSKGMAVLRHPSTFLKAGSLQRYNSINSIEEVAFLHKAVFHGRSSPYPANCRLSPDRTKQLTYSIAALRRAMWLNCWPFSCENTSKTAHNFASRILKCFVDQVIHSCCFTCAGRSFDDEHLHVLP